MDVHYCMHCGNPILSGASVCPSCGADLTSATEPPLPRQVHGSTAKSGWEVYEVPWFDLPLAFSIIRDPTLVPPQSADETMKKYAGRALVLTAVAFMLSFVMFFAAVLPAVLGLLWALMVVRVGKANRSRTSRKTAAVAFALGLFACVNVVATILLSIAANAPAD